jgi:phosphotransferase system, enzyme I, PtsP
VLQPIHPLRLRVHDRDGPVADILRLMERASGPGALPHVLEALCREVSTILTSPVISIYVRGYEPDDDVLVMRANVGLPPGAVDRVRLRIGEGITGFAAECLRPVSADAGPHHERYKAVPDIGEEHFPCYLAVPLVQGGQALGVMVLQRPAQEPFDSTQVLLGTALAAPFAHALDLARSGRGAAGSFGRDVILQGEPIAGGTALGAARLLPTMVSVLQGHRPDPDVGRTLDEVCRGLAKTARRVRGRLAPHASVALGALVPLLSDQRLRTRVVQACAEQGVVEGLEGVVHAYARAPYQVGGADAGSAEWLADRAQDVEDLCLLVAARLAGLSLFGQGDALWIGGRLGGVVALEAAARRVSSVVVAQPVDRAGLATGVLEAAQIPVVAHVSGLFEWVRPGDRLLVDGDTGRVHVNPAPRRLARYRGRRRP